jgi:hypothetical protein
MDKYEQDLQQNTNSTFVLATESHITTNEPSRQRGANSDSADATTLPKLAWKSQQKKQEQPSTIQHVSHGEMAVNMAAYGISIW